MNKRRKILTLVGIVVFGLIIFFHYCDPAFHQGQVKFGVGGAWHGGRYQAGSIEPLIADVQMPLFVLAVVYAGLFFLFGGKDAAPVPRRRVNWRLTSGEILAGLVVGSLLAAIVYSLDLEKRKEATRQANIEEEDSKHRIKSSEIDLIDLKLGAPYGSSYPLTGRIRNRSAHNSTLNSITLIATLRGKEGSPDILGEETVQIRVEVPPHQTRAISQSIYFPNLPQLKQPEWEYFIVEIRGSKGYDLPNWFDMNAPAVSPTPSPKP